MKWFNGLSFVSRIVLAMTLSLLLNLVVGYSLKSILSQREYVVSAEVVYSKAGSMQVLFDTGDGFKSTQQVNIKVGKGKNSVNIPFRLKENDRLKFLRLDFGNDEGLSEVGLTTLSLSTENKMLFALNEKDIVKQIALAHCLKQIDETNNFKIDVLRRPFDPYIVFSSVNELIYPLWQRTILLVAPWLILLLLPVLNWIRQRLQQGELELLLAALFLAVVPLKTAWITFAALLLLGYAIFVGIKNKKIQFGPNQIAIMALFIVPFLFLGDGRFSKLAIPFGFILLPLICAILDFSSFHVKLKNIYTKVFFVLMSIIIVCWVLLICYEGYFYGIGLENYFFDLKSNAHRTLYWLYYDHTTFLSFFILLGGVFCYELFKKGQVSNIYMGFYTLFSYTTVLLLGSRFTIALAILLPILFMLSVNRLSKILLPLWIACFTTVVYFIAEFDDFRARLWRISSNRILENPWFGHGTGNSEILLPDSLPIQKAGVETAMQINHSHSQFLTYMLENGFIGTLLAMALMIFIFYQFVKEKNRTMLLVILAILMLMIIESPFRTATPLYLISFLLSVFSVPTKKTIS